MNDDSGLIIVDVQNDFCPGGALAVSEGDQVVPVLNRYAERFASRGQPIFASRDWHPAASHHFRQHGGVWPVHCVQGTPGAAFHPGLRLPSGAIVITKGSRIEDDAYSGFEATTPEGQPLADVLKRLGVGHVYVGGLATDYCVKSTVLDALKNGFRATLLVDAARGVNLKPHDSERAIEEMVQAGADLTTLERIS